MLRKVRGFTLIELLVVISIIGILATIVFSSLAAAGKKGKAANVQSQLEQLQTAFQFYYEDTGDYPPAPTGTDFCNWCTIPNNNYYANDPNVGNNPLYLQQFDIDPSTGQPYQWSTIVSALRADHVLPAGANIANDPWGRPYIYDKNYHQTQQCSGWSPICSMGPNGAIDTNNCQPWPATPAAGGDDICIFLPND